MDNQCQDMDLDLDRKPSDGMSDASLDRNTDEAIDEDVIKIFGDLEKILGDDPAQQIKKEVNLHPTLVTRWKDWIVTGLSKGVLNELMDKYPRTGNVNLEPPILNPEVAHSLKEAALKRDRHFVYAQKLAGTALSALGSAISMLLREDAIDKLKLLELMSDAAKLLIQVHNKESSARIAYILPGMSKQIKAVLEETKPDTLLFGHGLAEKLQDAIALEKLGKELKLQQALTTPKKPNAKPNGNPKWKKPTARRPEYSRHVDNRPRPPGPNRNYYQKPRPTPYQSGPLSQQNQERTTNNRQQEHRRS